MYSVSVVKSERIIIKQGNTHVYCSYVIIVYFCRALALVAQVQL